MDNPSASTTPPCKILIPTWPIFNPSSTQEDSFKAVSDIGVILENITNPSLDSELTLLGHSIMCYKSLYALAGYLYLLTTNERPVKDRRKECAARHLPGFDDGSLDRTLCQILAKFTRILIQEDTSEEERVSMPEERIKVVARRLYRPTGRMHGLAMVAKVLLEDYSLSLRDQIKFSTYVLETHVKIFTEPSNSQEARGKSHWYDEVGKGDEATMVDPMALLVEAWNEKRGL